MQNARAWAQISVQGTEILNIAPRDANRLRFRQSGIMWSMAEPPSQRPQAEPAHDVLAAEAFAVPAPDPDLRHGPVVLPEDPTGDPEPHDILAAEEFPMPSPRQRPGSGSGGRARAARRGGLAAAAGSRAGVVLRRRRP